VAANGCVYEIVVDCGLLSCPLTPKFERCRMLELPLKPKCFIPLVRGWLFLLLSSFIIKFAAMSFSPCAGFGDSYVIFCFSVGLFGFEMCLQMRWLIDVGLFIN